MKSQKTLYTNIFGEPFFEDGGTIFKVSPETGDIEPICKFAEFDPARLGGSARPAGSEPLPGAGDPLCSGRGFRDPESDGPLLSEANTFYAAIRAGIRHLDDGDSVRLEIAP